MKLGKGVADLHMHTTASDGTCSVSERVDQASQQNLEAIAVTDHDIISTEIQHRTSNINKIELISGVEVRADVDDTKVEILGYYVNPNESALESLLEQVRDYRRERNKRIISRVQKLTDLEIEYGDIREKSEGLIGRPHIAQTLIEAGVVDSISAAFEKYLGSTGEAYIPMERIPAGEVIETIHKADGVASLAHPGRIRSNNVEGIVDYLVERNIDAIEVPYPYDDSPDEGYADLNVEDAAALANEFNLLQTGGSDCHGPGSGKFRIGDVRIDSKSLKMLRKKASERSEL